MTCAYSREHPSIKLALIELGKTALSARDLSKRLGMKHVATYRVIEWLRTRGLIHVSYWDTSISPFARMFVAGPGRDAIKPPWNCGRAYYDRSKKVEAAEVAEPVVEVVPEVGMSLQDVWR